MKILRELLVCPFCMRESTEDVDICCGEIGHSEKGYELEDGEIVLASEVEQE